MSFYPAREYGYAGDESAFRGGSFGVGAATSGSQQFSQRPPVPPAFRGADVNTSLGEFARVIRGTPQPYSSGTGSAAPSADVPAGAYRSAPESQQQSIADFLSGSRQSRGVAASPSSIVLPPASSFQGAPPAHQQLMQQQQGPSFFAASPAPFQHRDAAQPGLMFSSLQNAGALTPQHPAQQLRSTSSSAAALAVPDLSESRLLMLGATPDESLIHVFTYIKNVFAAEPGEENFDLWTLSAADAGGLIQRLESELLRILETGRPRGVAPQFKYGTTYTQGVVNDAAKLQQQQQQQQQAASAAARSGSTAAPPQAAVVTLPTEQPQPQQDQSNSSAVAPTPQHHSVRAAPPVPAHAPPPLPPHLRNAAAARDLPQQLDAAEHNPNVAKPQHVAGVVPSPSRRPPSEPRTNSPGMPAAAAAPGGASSKAAMSNSVSRQHPATAAAAPDAAQTVVVAAAVAAPVPPMEPDRPLKETMRRLRAGAVLTKFALHNDGKPQLRFFRLVNRLLAVVDGAEPIPVPHLCWSQDAKATPATYLCLMNLIDVRLGARAAGVKGKFRRNDRGEVVGSRGEVLPDAMCITYVFPDREVNVCPATDVDFDVWYYGMVQVLERNQKLTVNKK